MALARRFRFERAHWAKSLSIHLAASGVFAMLWMALRAGLEQWLTRDALAPVTFGAAFSRALVATFSFNLLIYWAIVSVSHALDISRRYREREVRAIELEKRLTEARLHALQMQLNPHFLFNTLHAISALMHDNVEAADRMITRLSDLLRATLANSDRQEVSLRQEIEFLRRYLEIEQTRFGPRLTVKMEIAPDTWDALVPNLILQPLVENAIRHGIEPRAQPGIVELTTYAVNGQLRMEVKDNGVGLSAGQPEREGVGLSNTRARLQQLYGAAHTFEMRGAVGAGLSVRLAIPLKTALGNDK
jgi:LytS/YehU family sensor histidine kinase